MTHRFSVLGDAMLDVTARTLSLDPRKSDVPSRNSFQPGGGGANIAVWLRALGQHVTLHGAIGRDGAGNMLQAALTAHGVDLALEVDPDVPTGTVIVLVDDQGERYMYSDPGASSLATLPEIAVADTDHVHLSAYALRSPRIAEQLAPFMAEMRRESITTSVDLAAPHVVHEYRHLLSELHVDITFGTGEEFEALDRSNPRGGVHVVKHGRDGVTAWDSTGEHHQPAPDVAVVDTTGAGDAYAAGFLARWVARHDVAVALAAGYEAARSALGRVGAWPPAPGAAR